MSKAMGIPTADKPEEAMTVAKGARSMQGGLFAANPWEMTDDDCAGIFEKILSVETSNYNIK